RQNTLFAAPFDLRRQALMAPPQPVFDDVSRSGYSGDQNFDVSQNGTFLYLSGTSGLKGSIFWLDREGKIEPILTEPRQYEQPRFSPEGRRLVYTVSTEQGTDIWVKDLSSGLAARKTFLPGTNWWPVWSPDGTAIAFHCVDGPRNDLCWIRADGAGEPQRLATGFRQAIPAAFSRDGKSLLLRAGTEIWVAPLEGDQSHPRLGTPTRVTETGTPVPTVDLSPDGHWLAYAAAESGPPEIFVRRFPASGGRWQVSTGGGRFPI